jgi:hypothetical protein
LLEKGKLNRANFMDWYSNLRIVLRQEKTEYVLIEPYPEDLPADLTAIEHRAHEKRCDDALNVSCLKLVAMSPDLHKQYEHVDAYTMIQGLRGIFENQARAERYNISKALFACKLAEGKPVSTHVIKNDLAIVVNTQSLPTSYESFIMNFHMNGMEKIVAELHGMLKIAGNSIKKNPNHVMMVQKEKKKRQQWTPPNGKVKEKVSDEPSSSKPKAKGKPSPSPDEECFHYHKQGHWFRNYKKYLEEQKKKKGSETSALGINVIEINIAAYSSDSWVFDTRLMIHPCKSL